MDRPCGRTVWARGFGGSLALRRIWITPLPYTPHEMNTDTREKIKKGLRTTEFWVVMLMSVLTAIMVVVQEHAENVLPVELAVKLLAVLGSVYVFCRTALKLVGTAAYFLRVDRDPLPVPLPPPGVRLPEMTMRRPMGPGGLAAPSSVASIAALPTAATTAEPSVRPSARPIAWHTLRAEELQEEERQALLKKLLLDAAPRAEARVPAPPARMDLPLVAPATSWGV